MKLKRIALDEPTEKFLASLKELRQQRGLSQGKIAHELGIQTRAYRLYEERRIAPKLSRLMQLAELLDYDLSASINYKKYYGISMKLQKTTKGLLRKNICLDDVAEKFLSELQNLRKKSGLTVDEVCVFVGINRHALLFYEQKKCNPSLGTFLNLAKLFDYDISKSVNYQYLHRTGGATNIPKRLKHYGLTAQELSELTNYDESTITNTMYSPKFGSIACFSAILNVLEQESKSAQFRARLLKEAKC